MSTWWPILSPIAAAALLFKAFQIMKHTGLRKLVLEWITSPSPSVSLQVQYCEIRNRFLGEQALSIRRLYAIMGIYLAIVGVLAAIIILRINIGATVYAGLYFFVWQNMPLMAVML